MRCGRNDVLRQRGTDADQKTRNQQKADAVRQTAQRKREREDHCFCQNDGATIVLVSERAQKENLQGIAQLRHRRNAGDNAIARPHVRCQQAQNRL